MAQKISWISLLAGTLVAFGIAASFLRGTQLWAGATAVLITAVTGAYYQRRLGGITGDCLGTTIQLAEIGVYLTGVMVRG